MPVEIITIGDDDDRRVLHLRLLHELGDETRHRDALARTLRVPDDAALSRTRLDPLAIGGARILDEIRFRLGLGCRDYGHSDRLPDRVKLMISGDFFDNPGVGVFEQDKVSQVVEQQLRRKETAHDLLQLKFQQRPVVLVANRAPREKALAVR